MVRERAPPHPSRGGALAVHRSRLLRWDDDDHLRLVLAEDDGDGYSSGHGQENRECAEDERVAQRSGHGALRTCPVRPTGNW
jgi:hypothetical protein